MGAYGAVSEPLPNSQFESICAYEPERNMEEVPVVNPKYFPPVSGEIYSSYDRVLIPSCTSWLIEINLSESPSR